MIDNWIVEGSFPPGDFRFKLLVDALLFVKEKRAEGYLVSEPRDLRVIICRIGFRLSNDIKAYLTSQMKNFCEKQDKELYSCIHFGKQDIRGVESITFVDHNNCVPKQIHFKNRWELFGYVKGFNARVN